jgi:transposase
MAGQLTPEAIVALHVLKEQGQSNRQIAQTLQVSEGAIRYHLRRLGAPDGRKGKNRKAEPLAQVIDSFFAHHGEEATQPNDPAQAAARPGNVLALFEWLQREHHYHGSYKSVLRFVRARYPRPRLRPFRRIETPPAAQAQVDWGDFAEVDVGDGPQTLHAFILVLSHSRKEVLVWSRRQDQLAWHHAHNLAFARIGGVPAVLRIDNLKTGVGTGAGPWGEVNDAYRVYARAMGFHVDACLPRCPEDKGKVESQVGHLKRFLRLEGQVFDSLDALQAWTDQRLDDRAQRRICPPTGETVQQSWLAEQPLLRGLPSLPLAFDVAVTRPVHKDCTVCFEGRQYSVPFVLCGLSVEVRGCSEVVQFWHEGQVVAQHPRHSRQRLLLVPAHYEGPGDDRVMPPVPLGQMGRKLAELAEQPVQRRSAEFYAALLEVSR